MNKAVPSAYIAGQRGVALTKAETTARIRDVAQYCQTCPSSDLPPEDMMQVIGSHDEAHFRAAMTGFFQELAQRGDLSAKSTVLDIGCGCGRLALPFVRHLSDGQYYGVDVWQEGIEWCRKRFADDAARASFILREARDNYYFDAKTGEANDFHLREIPSPTVDFAFAISVFTHLNQRDCYSYLSELNRVLAPGSCAYITGFIIDDFFFDYVARSGKHTAVRQEGPGCYYAYEGQDFFAAYTDGEWVRMIENSGLRIVAKDLGTWAEKPGAKNYQDSFIVVPAAFRR